MKLLIITSLYRPYVRGGAEVVVDEIVQELAKRHEVHVITLSPWKGWKSLWPHKTLENGVHITRFFPLNLFSFIHIAAKPAITRACWHLIDLLNVHSYFTVRTLLHEIKPDKVYTHNLMGIGYTVPLAIRHAGIVHIHTLHDIQLAVPSGILMYGKEHEEKNSMNAFHARCSRRLFGSPGAVIFPSFFLKTFYESRFFFPKSTTYVLRNPVPQLQLEDSTVRNLHTDGTIHFFAAGALNTAKGMLFLCATFSALEDQDIHLWIAGSGPDDEEIRKLCARDSRISFLGRLAHEELLKELKRMHYAIIPSRCYENAPTVLTESCALGVPVIVADIGGAAEGIENGMQGFVFKPGDAQSLAQTIRRAVQYPEYALLCKRARQMVTGRTCAEYARNLVQINGVKSHFQ